MKERPILFSGPMVRAILDGSKTQTRRIVKPQPPDAASIPLICDDGSYYEDWRGTRRHVNSPKCPFWRGEGTNLWVRETWSVDQCYNDLAPSEMPGRFEESPGHFVRYHAEGGNYLGKTRSSIHMPRWASRINLLVTGVRAERLQEISEDDAMAEGVQPFTFLHDRAYHYRNGFRSVWESINGAVSWDANPYVWVVEFTREEGAQ